MTRLIVNILGFQAGWLACIIGAANGLLWLGPLVVAGIVGANLALHSARRRELAAIGVIAAGGTAIDTTLHLSGLILFEPGGEGPIAVPLFVVWIGALWVNFAATLSVSLRWLASFPVIASILGATSGPLTYYAGARLGAIGFSEPVWVPLLLLALEWMAVLPAALILSRRIHLAPMGEKRLEGMAA